MARLSEVSTFYDRLPSDAVEWRYGEARTAECILYADPDGDALQDLAGGTVEAHAEHYFAAVETERRADGETTLSISKMRLQEIPIRDLAVVVKDQAQHPGESPWLYRPTCSRLIRLRTRSRTCRSP